MMIAPKIALQKPGTLKQGTISLTNSSINALMIKMKTPSVTRINGRLSNNKIGRIKALMMPSKIDAHDRRGDEYRKRRHNPTENKMSHAQSLLDIGVVAKPGRESTCQSSHPQ